MHCYLFHVISSLYTSVLLPIKRGPSERLFRKIFESLLQKPLTRGQDIITSAAIEVQRSHREWEDFKEGEDLRQKEPSGGRLL